MYAEEGVTGTSTRRRMEFQRMIEDAVAGNIDLIITKSVSRFARNTLDLLRIVRHLKQMGVAVWFEEQDINSLTEEGERKLKSTDGVIRRISQKRNSWKPVRRCLASRNLMRISSLIKWKPSRCRGHTNCFSA